MSAGDARNAALSRAAILVAAGGGLVALTQRAPELSLGTMGKVMLVVGALFILGGLILVLRTFTRGGADQ